MCVLCVLPGVPTWTMVCVSVGLVHVCYFGTCSDIYEHLYWLECPHRLAVLGPMGPSLT